MTEPIFMKLGMYITAPEPISKAYFINSFHQSVCIYVYPLIIVRQWFGKNSLIVVRQRLSNNVTMAINTRRNNRRIVEHIVFYAVHVTSKKVGD
jgi:hypothetical protein